MIMVVLMVHFEKMGLTSIMVIWTYSLQLAVMCLIFMESLLHQQQARSRNTHFLNPISGQTELAMDILFHYHQIRLLMELKML